MGNPVKLELLRTIPGYETEETFLHRHLRNHRVSGEWFDIKPVLKVMELLDDKGKLPASMFDSSHDEQITKLLLTGHLPSRKHRSIWQYNKSAGLMYPFDVDITYMYNHTASSILKLRRKLKKI